MTAFGPFLRKGFHHPDPVDRFRQVRGDLRHLFLQLARIPPDHPVEQEEIQKMDRQSDQGDQRQLPADEEQCAGHDRHCHDLLSLRDHDPDQARKQRHIADHVGNQFARPVFFVKAQGKTLQMLEDLLTHIQQDPRHGVGAEPAGHHPHAEPEHVNDDQDHGQQEEQTPVFGGQHPVDYHFQDQRHGQGQHGQHDRGHCREENHPPILFDQCPQAESSHLK